MWFCHRCAICGFKVLHKELILSPVSLCFSPCVVSQPVRGMCFLFACICTGVKTSQLQPQGVGVNSFCNTGCPLRPIVLLGRGVVCIGQSVLSPTQTGLSSQSTDGWIRKQRREGRQCQECTARWHFRSKPYLKIHFLCFTSCEDINVFNSHTHTLVLQILHASTLLHFSVHLLLIEQRLFLWGQQCVTSFLSVLVRVFILLLRWSKYD